MLQREEAEARSRLTLHQRVVALAKLVETMSIKVCVCGGAWLGDGSSRLNPCLRPLPACMQMFDLQGRLDSTEQQVSRIESVHGQSASIGILGASEAQSLQV